MPGERIDISPAIHQRIQTRITHEAFPSLLEDITSREGWQGNLKPPNFQQSVSDYVKGILNGVSAWDSDFATIPNLVGTKWEASKVVGLVQAQFDEIKGKIKLRQYDRQGI